MTRCTNSLIRHKNRGVWSAKSIIGEECIGNSSNCGERRDEIENLDDPPVVSRGGERNEEQLGNSGSNSVGGGMEIVVVGERKNDSPLADDVCSICFGNFIIPFKTNCGHWFCGSCILQFWNSKASLQKCKCPICSCLISKLTPEACLLSRQEKEVTEVLENVPRYNRLFEGGVRGLVQVATLTGHSMWILHLAMSPDGQTIVTGAGDETLRFWNIFPSMKLRHR